MTNSKISAAEYYLNLFEDFSNELKFKGETFIAVTDKSIILRDENGKLNDHYKPDLIDTLNFQIEMGTFEVKQITKENAQSSFAHIRSLLPA